MLSSGSESLVSVLLADLPSGVRLHERLGTGEAQRAIDRCVNRAGRCVTAFGGQIVSTRGHELAAIFDSANQAFQAAIEMQQKVGDLPPVSGLKLEIRIGLAYGPARLAGDDLSGEAVDVAATLAGMGNAGQILTSTHSVNVLSSTFRDALKDLGAGLLRNGAKGSHVFVYDPGHTASDGSESSPAAPPRRLKLTHADQLQTFEGLTETFLVGRDKTCHLRVRGEKVSRRHAAIEYRDNRFYLIDRSTNGTFIKIGKEPEVRLHQQEFTLRGKGVFGLASSTYDPETDLVYFELPDTPR